MRKELGGILLFFLVILTLVSLVTYNSGDPALNQAASDQSHNFFGPLGAYTADLLLSGFGLGAFWIPFLLLLAGSRLIARQETKIIVPTVLGGLLLIIASGGLLLANTSLPFS